MKYCTLHFEVHFLDGSSIQGEAPYRGVDLSKASLEGFIKRFFAGPKAVDGAGIIVENINEYDNPKQWLLDIKHWDSFKYLRNVNNFAGELMAEYFPEE